MAAKPHSRQRPGRPSTGARDRILDATLEVLKRDGYAGLTTAKVAVGSGQNKALINYHFGSKQGLVAEVARGVADTITEEVLSGIGRPGTAAELVEGLVDGVWRVMERDEGIQRVYFDLASQSVVEPDVRSIMAELKAGFREVLRGLLREVEDGPPTRQAEAAAVFLIAGVEGLALERLDRGETPELRRARAMFVRSAPVAIGA
jgi:TetR/AcrR family transcriptional repressor of bet genes